MSGHTPGPWTREEEFIYGADGLPVGNFCTAERSTDQDIINATLGQAAPELLEALRRRRFDCTCPNLPPGQAICDDCKRDSEIIAKAERRS